MRRNDPMEDNMKAAFGCLLLGAAGLSFVVFVLFCVVVIKECFLNLFGG